MCLFHSAFRDADGFNWVTDDVGHLVSVNEVEDGFGTLNSFLVTYRRLMESISPCVRDGRIISCATPSSPLLIDTGRGNSCILQRTTR